MFDCEGRGSVIMNFGASDFGKIPGKSFDGTRVNKVNTVLYVLFELFVVVANTFENVMGHHKS